MTPETVPMQKQNVIPRDIICMITFCNKYFTNCIKKETMACVGLSKRQSFLLDNMNATTTTACCALRWGQVSTHRPSRRGLWCRMTEGGRGGFWFLPFLLLLLVVNRQCCWSLNLSSPLSLYQFPLFATQRPKHVTQERAVLHKNGKIQEEGLSFSICMRRSVNIRAKGYWKTCWLQQDFNACQY